MRKPNPTITKIQVRHRAFTIYGMFRKWVLENGKFVEYNLIEQSSYDDLHFCQINAQSIHMLLRPGASACPKDKLRLNATISRDGQLLYQVGFLEYFENEEGPAYHSVCVEEFAVYDLHKALECLMERWNSNRPWAASSIKKSSHSDFVRAYRKIGINSMLKINIDFTPKEMYAHLAVLEMVNYRAAIGMGAAFYPGQRHVVRPDCGDHAIKISAKEVMEIEGGKTVFSDGVVMMEDSDVCPSLEQIRAAKVGYTGNKNNHGSGSMDHISW